MSVGNLHWVVPLQKQWLYTLFATMCCPPLTHCFLVRFFLAVVLTQFLHFPCDSIHTWRWKYANLWTHLSFNRIVEAAACHSTHTSAAKTQSGQVYMQLICLQWLHVCCVDMWVYLCISCLQSLYKGRIDASVCWFCPGMLIQSVLSKLIRRRQFLKR